MSRITVALIGLGLAAEPHARSLVELQDKVRVKYAVSRSFRRTEAFASRYPFPVGTDVQAAISDPEVDLVILLTPPDTHLALCELAFSHGKHVLVEKPLEVSLERAERLVSDAERAGVYLGVVLQHRFRRGALCLGQRLKEGALGEVQAASLAMPWWRPQSYYDEPGRGSLARDGGGVLMTQAIHLLDLARSLLAPVNVRASHATTTSLHDMETEDHVMALLDVAGGAPANLMASTAWYPGFPERLEIIGSRGTARLEGGDLSISYQDGEVELITENSGTGSGADPMGFAHDAHLRLIEDMLDAVASGRQPRVSGQDALGTQLLIDELIQISGVNSG